MDAKKWRQLLPRPGDSDDAIRASRNSLRNLLKAREAHLKHFYEEQPEQAQRQQHPDQLQLAGAIRAGEADGAVAAKQQSCHPWECVRQLALGFTPLTSVSTTPAPAYHPGASVEREQGGFLSDGDAEACNPDSFRTPAVAKLPAPGQGLHGRPALLDTRQSDVPTVLPAGAPLVRSAGVHSPAKKAQPRQWGVLPLLQQAGGAAPPGEAAQQQRRVPAPERAVLQQHRGGSHAGSTPAAAKPRGFQGQLQNRRPRANAGASQQAAGARKAAGGTGAAAKGGRLKAYFGSRQQAETDAAPPCADASGKQSGRKRAWSQGPEEAVAGQPAERQRPPPAQQPIPPDEIECLPSVPKGKCSVLDIMPSGELSAWHLKGRAAKQQRQLMEWGQRSLGSTAAASGGSGQKLCLMPAGAPTPLPPQHAAGQPSPAAAFQQTSGTECQPHGSPAASAGGLQLRLVAAGDNARQQLHPAANSLPATEQPKCGARDELQGSPLRATSQPAQACTVAAQAALRAPPAAAGVGDPGAAPHADPPPPLESELTASMPHARLQPHSYVPETCLSVYGVCPAAPESVPDTPDGRSGSGLEERGGSQDSGGCAALAQPSQSQQQRQPQEASAAAEGSGEHALSQPGERTEQQGDGGAGDNGTAGVGGGLLQPDSCPAAVDQSPQDRKGRELRMCFGSPILAAAPSTSGRMVAVCLGEPGPPCSVQVWQMPCPGQHAACLGAISCTLCKCGPEELQLQRSFAVAATGDGDTVLVTTDRLALAAQGGHPCVSLALFSGPGSGGSQNRPRTQQLPTPARTYCLHLEARDNHLFAAGEGGAVQVWRPGKGGWRSPLAEPPLPAAAFGGTEFPNIAELAPAGPGCVLGCSSAGSMALWDYTRRQLLIARQDPSYAFASLHWVPFAAPALAAVASPPQVLAARMRARGASPAQPCSNGLKARRAASAAAWQPGYALLLPQRIGALPFPVRQPVTQLASNGELVALAFADGTVRVADLKGRPVCTMPPMGAVSSLVFSSSQQLLLSAGAALYQYTFESQADGLPA